MKYSVIMPTLTRDREHHEVMVKCVESVLKHSKDFELIMVDDGSPRKLGVIKNRADLYVRHKTSKGIAPSWNDGLKLARGKYLCVINDDIEAQPEWLDRMADLFRDPYVGAASLAVENMPRIGGIVETHVWFPGSVFMLSQETLERVGFFDEQFTPFNYEDVDYWTRILKLGGKLMRDYSIEIPHREGDVLKKLEYGDVSQKNRKLFIKKWGFDPKEMFYGNGEIAWQQ